MTVSGPIRLERDGGVAVVVLDDPPLNLFTRATPSTSSMDCLDEVEASDARALVWRAEGEVFTGGVDVARASSRSSTPSRPRPRAAWPGR